jgi:uncharacterized membrane protein YoaK (UPF0700 family)
MRPGPARVLAVLLTALAGAVDAIGYMALGGYFVAFMSGNSTLLALGVAAQADHRIELAGGLVAAFVAGVVLGALLHRLGGWRATWVLLLVAALLVAAWAAHRAGAAMPAAFLMALAMGAENTAFQTRAQGGVALTYLTGTIVRLGQRIADALTGGSWAAVWPEAVLWVAMVGGAVLGAFGYARAGTTALLGAAAAALAIAAAAELELRRAARAA